MRQHLNPDLIRSHSDSLHFIAEDSSLPQALSLVKGPELVGGENGGGEGQHVLNSCHVLSALHIELFIGLATQRCSMTK